MADNTSDFFLFSGSSHPELAAKIAQYLEMPLAKVALGRFPDGEISLQIEENVRGREVFVIQTIALDPNVYLMELLIMVDALKRASAKAIHAVIPYFGYSRQDRRDKPRVAITAKLVADLLTVAGVDSVVTMDLHSEQVQGFFDIPVDNLYAKPLLAEAFREMASGDVAVVGPDIGSIKLARKYAAHLKCDFAIIDKQRLDAQHVEMAYLIGDVEGKDVLLADDMCSTGTTLVSAAKACRGKGAKRIYAAVTHGVFTKNSIALLENSPLTALLVSDTIPNANRMVGLTKVKTVSVASLFGQAIRCTILRESISSLSN